VESKLPISFKDKTEKGSTFCYLSGQIPARDRFTDKGTPGAILGRKAMAFAILNFRF
jgi:hypothetical protein